MMNGSEDGTLNVGQESQLLNEERWLIQSLKKIAQQRNSLQIEKLQLKYLLNTLQSKSRESSPQPGTSMESNEEDTNVHTFKTATSTLPRDFTNPPVPDFSCHEEQLNLNVEYPMLQSEFDEDEHNSPEEDDDDEENDLNFYINGPNQKETTFKFDF